MCYDLASSGSPSDEIQYLVIYTKVAGLLTEYTLFMQFQKIHRCCRHCWGKQGNVETWQSMDLSSILEH